MKNSNIKPGQLVPPHIRVEVYTEMIEAIKNNELTFGVQTHSNVRHGQKSYPLCLTLPCLLWGLEGMFEDAPDGDPWSTSETPDMFPEIAFWANIAHNYYLPEANEKRIEVLEQAIKQLQHEEK